MNATASSALVVTATRSPTSRPSATATITLTPTPYPIPTGRSECSEKKFKSASLNQDMPFYLYLPRGYFDQTQRRYPVIYLLSGLGGRDSEWKDYQLCSVMDQFILDGKIPPLIIAMPSGNDNPAGGIGSFWFNHAPPPLSDGKKWGDYVWKDLVSYIDANYRTLPRRASRAIGGLSAGGQGALTDALTHPELFAAVGAHSPSFRRADGSVAYFGDEQFYNQYDPIWLVKNTSTARQLTIWIDVGDRDDQWGDSIREYHALLDALKIPHAWNLFFGYHDPPYWQTHVPDYLLWYASKLAGQ
ncbi:MAG: hypothetical protein HY257_03365 [Chloroflexi bacterium]|nr:hypothetical protein [Chloroflexota bacterium]